MRAIEVAGRRAADLCRQLLACSGRGSFVVQPVDVNAVLAEASELLQVSVSRRAEVRFDLDERIPPVEADATQLRQVLMNLLTNASEALENGAGIIEVRTGVRDCGADCLAGAYFSAAEPGRFVELEVRDDGRGMTAEVRERLFEPCYSTRFAGRGLGMAAVLGIVRGHRGAIEVDSEPGEGAHFRVLLPATSAAVAAFAPTRAIRGDWHETGTVMLVDDEELVRSTVGGMLRRVGFDVCMASDGVDAVAQAATRTRTTAETVGMPEPPRPRIVSDRAAV